MTIRDSWLFGLGTAIGLAGCSRAPSAAGGEKLPGGAITKWTDSTELFMEHPALVVGSRAKFAVHLTDLTDFAPIREGTVTLRFTPAGGGAPVTVTQTAPRSPGLYGPEVSFDRAGRYDLAVLVESPQNRDSIAVPGMVVYPADDEVPAEEDPGEASIAFLKEQQWKTPGFATALAGSGKVARGVLAPGRLVAAAGRHAVVSAPIAGLVQASGVEVAPAPGVRVRAGQGLAVLTPTLGEGGAAYATARAELREAEDEYARAQRLRAVEAVSERRVHQAKIRLDAAREALAGLTGGVGADEGRITIRSPIGGVVATRTLLPGARVEAGEQLFTIVDPSVLWLEAQVAAPDMAAVRRPTGATFAVAGDPAERRAGRLVSVGGVIDSLTRSVAILFEVPNRDGLLRVGELAQVTVLIGGEESGVVVPETAVVDDDGQPVAFVQTEGESFERRLLHLGPSQGGSVVIRSGIQAGERVVTGAAPIVRLASRSSALPAHGHEH